MEELKIEETVTQNELKQSSTFPKASGLDENQSNNDSCGCHKKQGQQNHMNIVTLNYCAIYLFIEMTLQIMLKNYLPRHWFRRLREKSSLNLHKISQVEAFWSYPDS